MSSSSHPYHLDANQRRGKECIKLRPFVTTAGLPEQTMFPNVESSEEGTIQTGKTTTYVLWRNEGDDPKTHPVAYPPPHSILWQTHSNPSFGASMGVSCPNTKTHTESATGYAFVLDEDLVEIPNTRCTFTSSVQMSYAKDEVSAYVEYSTINEGYSTDIAIRGYCWQYYVKAQSYYEPVNQAEMWVVPSLPIVTHTGQVPARAGIGFVKL